MSTLPVISPEDLSDPRRCLVTLNNRVYDVTQFLPDHPGGADLIQPYLGKDVSTIMTDELSHDHSESAYEILEEFLVGVLSTSKPSQRHPNLQPISLSHLRRRRRLQVR